MIRSVITGTGSALPAKCVTNADLAARVDTSDEWIVERTGIRQRYIAGDSETTSTLATAAARNALEAAGVDAQEIGLIVLATATPDHTFPATATQVQAALGCGGGVRQHAVDHARFGAIIPKSTDRNHTNFSCKH